MHVSDLLATRVNNLSVLYKSTHVIELMLSQSEIEPVISVIRAKHSSAALSC